MLSFLSRFFGGGDGDGAGTPVQGDPVTYKGHKIVATPAQEGTQWRVSGRIGKTIGGETIERPFIRADLCSSPDEAIEVSVRKAKQIIDENPNIFDDPTNTMPV